MPGGRSQDKYTIISIYLHNAIVTLNSQKAAPRGCFPLIQTISSAILLSLLFLSALSAQEHDAIAEYSFLPAMPEVSLLVN